MAVEFTTEHTRTAEYLFLPNDIKIKPELNGRHDLPDIEWLIDSIVDSGQLQPVLIGRDGGAPVLYAGHSRWRAVREINRRKLTAEPVKLRCVYFKGSEQEAFLATIRENRDRTSTTPIDDAHNIAKLERYGRSLEDIAAKVYHEDVKWVRGRLALIELCDEAAKKVAAHEIKPNAATALAKMSKDDQRAALKNGDLSAGALRKASSPQRHPVTKRISVRTFMNFWRPQSEVKITSATSPIDRNLASLAGCQVRLLEGADPDEIWNEIRKLVREN